MRNGLARYARRHHWGMLATLIALGGTAYASGFLPVVPPNSVGTVQIKRHAVTLGKISSAAQTALHRPRGPAGGALAGSYPSPRVNIAVPSRPSVHTGSRPHFH
jgi:hypothetical protein